MKKVLFIFGLFVLTSLLFAGLGSAYYYNDYDRDYYDGYSYTATRYRDHGYGLQYKVNSYDRITAEGYENGEYVKTTAYVKTTRESPGYYGGYGGRYNARPWYQNYYQYPDYNRNYYVYDYRPSVPYRYLY